MNIEEDQQATLDALVEPLARKDRKDAKELLRIIMETNAKERHQIMLPIAVHIMRHKNWQSKINIIQLCDYCEKHESVVTLLRNLENPVVDAEAEYMVGMACNLAGMFDLWVRSKKTRL